MVYIHIKVPKEVAQGISPRELADVVSRYYYQKTASVSNIDIQPADNGATRTQENWIQYFNEKGQQMISAPLAYKIGQSVNLELLQSVRDDFDKSWLVTSTRETYNPNTLDARIIHNHGSTIVQQTEKTVLVPVYQRALLDDVLKEEE